MCDMAKFFPMFSGSKGNSTYIGDHSGGILVDVGVSFKRLKEKLESRSIPLSHIKAVLITHEHSDHIKGLKLFLKNCPVPVIASRPTIYALEYAGAISYDTERIYIDEVENYDIGEILVSRFATSHDCEGSSGFVITFGDTKTAVCTDLGIMTEDVINNLCGCRLVMLESNHDPVMLRMGPYPAELKLRISSDKGHLSNAVCAQTLATLHSSGTTHFVLAHLSEENNTPQKAGSAARAALMDIGACENSDYILYIAPPDGDRVIPL